MISIFDVPQAKTTILARRSVQQSRVPAALQRRLDELFGPGTTPPAAVQRILHDVQERGDTALLDWTKRIDGLRLPSLSLTANDMDQAYRRIPTDLAEALEVAAARIRQFHRYQPLPNWSTAEMGGIVGQRATPIQKVGVYVPGGTAPLPSSLLMAVIPAQVAGVPEVVVITPPGRPDGRVPDVILAAGHLAGLDGMYIAGGAQAIAALTFGTESIPRVDKIVGPGNLFVTLAKRQVYGIVGIDGLYGPTETIVVADETADAGWVAADMLAQAEHDVLATAILLTPSRSLATAVQREIGLQLEERGRSDIISVALATQGGIVLTSDMDEACQLANEFAAEHTCVAAAEPERWSRQINHAGGLFIGEHSYEVLGDYVAGPSHTMPTGGTARFASPLNVSDFVKITSIVELDEATSAHLSPYAARIAAAEGLDGHAAAAMKRVDAQTAGDGR